MNPLITILVVSWLAGFAAFIGGLAGHLEKTKNTEAKEEWLHGIIAFGGGILVAAVAFALAPEAIAALDPWILGIAFCSGGGVFCVIDILVSRGKGTKAQFLAMMMDFIPEAISLGAVFSGDRQTGLLLAAFIGAQNLPEGFNAYREFMKSGGRAGHALILLLAASLFGPLSAGAGHLFLQNRPALTAGIMIFAGGGILYLIFQDIAPQAKMKRHWSPPLGAVLGFAVGLLGKALIG